MKTIFNISLVLFSTISFGWCFLLDEYTEAHNRITSCFLDSTISGYYDHACYDHVKLESCLKKISATDRADKTDIYTRLLWSENMRAVCPGFVGKDKCRDGESFKCKDKMRTRRSFGDRSICNELQEVRDCLVSKLNDSCLDSAVEGELFEVEVLDNECKAGTFNGGPCGLRTIWTCNAPLEVDENVRSNCDDALFKNATQCLSHLDKTCKTEEQQRAIRNEKLTLKLICKLCSNKQDLPL